MLLCVFFFFKQKTAYEMRISDWSSDVCSSDLPREGIQPDEAGKIGPIKFIESLKQKGHLVAYVGDVVGTGSSRKSATNSVLWHTGEDIPFVPNKRFGGVRSAERRVGKECVSKC